MRAVKVEEFAALDRLVKVAQGDSGQSRRVANFLLAWWNAANCGGFDLTDLWNVDETIAADMIAVFSIVARWRNYPDSAGLKAEFEQLVTEWRPHLVQVAS